MLSQKDEKVERVFAIPPKIKTTYKNFALLRETSSYKMYEAESCDSNEKHTIRVLDHSKKSESTYCNLAASLFVQELLHLQQKYPGSIFTNTFEISDNGRQIACATLSCIPLSCQLDEIREVFNSKDSQLLQQLISDVIYDIDFLWKSIQTKKVKDLLQKGSLCFMREKNAFFLTDWLKIFGTGANELGMSLHQSQTATRDKKLIFKEITEELEAFTLDVANLKKATSIEMANLLQVGNIDPKGLDTAIKAMPDEFLSEFQQLRSSTENMVGLDVKSIPNFEELRVKNVGAQPLLKPEIEEEKHTKKEAEEDIPSEKTLKINGNSMFWAFGPVL